MITNDEQHQAALKEIERIFDSHVDSPEGQRLAILVDEVERYEKERWKW